MLLISAQFIASQRSIGSLVCAALLALCCCPGDSRKKMCVCVSLLDDVESSLAGDDVMLRWSTEVQPPGRLQRQDDLAVGRGVVWRGALLIQAVSADVSMQCGAAAEPAVQCADARVSLAQ